MLNAFREMSREAGWNDASQINILMDFLDSLVREGKITTEDFLDFVDEKVADEKAISDEGQEEEKKRRIARIIEKHQPLMGPGCDIILDEFYDLHVDHWDDGRKVHVFTLFQQEFKCTLRETIPVCQLLFDGEDR